MYEENRKPLPSGDATKAFAQVFAEMQENCQFAPPQPLAPDNVLQWANTGIQPYLSRICRRLLLPGSGIAGLDNLIELTELAADGNSCIVCLNHRSNLDVPTLLALLEDCGNAELFHKLIWIAGRKLQEDQGYTQLLVQAVNRVIVTPRTWFREHQGEQDHHLAHQINAAAHRAIHELRHQRWVFALFPAGTRARLNDPSSTRAVEETDSYLKTFRYMLLCRIDGCTLPVGRDHDMSQETPALDTMQYTFGSVNRTDQWREQAAGRFPDLSQRLATARAITQDIDELASGQMSLSHPLVSTQIRES